MSKPLAGTQFGLQRNVASGYLKTSRCWLRRSPRSASKSLCHAKNSVPCWPITWCEAAVRRSHRQGRCYGSRARDIRLRSTRAMKLRLWILQAQWRLIGSLSTPPAPRVRPVFRRHWHPPSRWGQGISAAVRSERTLAHNTWCTGPGWLTTRVRMKRLAVITACPSIWRDPCQLHRPTVFPAPAGPHSDPLRATSQPEVWHTPAGKNCGK